MANKAAFLMAAKDHPFQVHDAPMPEPGPHQMIVKTRAVAINPADVAVQSQGLFLKEFPAVLGEDVAGEVVSVGGEVTRFKPGDRVVAFAADTELSLPFSGAFQLYCRANDDLAAIIPDNVPDVDAAVLPLGLSTAASALFMKDSLALPHPRLGAEPTGSTLLVWGASSSVGSCAVQMSRAAGFDIAATSSAHNFQYCRDLGAEHVFDYRSTTVVDDIVEGLRGKQSAGVICAVGDHDSIRKCAQVASRLGGRKFVATILPPLEAIPMPSDLPSDVTMGRAACSYIRSEPCGEAIWTDWLSAALENGSMECKPRPEVVGRGLEKIQDALDLVAKGVSAKKIVVQI